MLRFLAPLTLLMGGCIPQNASITTGEYFAFLSDSTSFSLTKGVVNPYDWCDGATGPTAEGDLPASCADRMWTIDCREFENKKERDALELPSPLDICDKWDFIDADEDPEPVDETWMGQSPWWVVTEELEPWRGEAILTFEGDLQLSFHHRLPGGEDFRFNFTLDPDFAPTRCTTDAGEAVAVDGDWVANWTEDLRNLIPNNPDKEFPEEFAYMEPYAATGTLYYLNDDAFQLNPDDTTDLWYFPEQYVAGTGNGKFSEEAFDSRESRYGYNYVYEFFGVYNPSEGYFSPPSQEDIFWVDLEADEDTYESTAYAGMLATVDDYVNEIRKDYRDAQVIYEPMWHDNLWRVPDGSPVGFDGWAEVHYSWAVVDGTIAEGESISGMFNMVTDGNDSNSRFIIRGEFEVDKIKMDRWTQRDLRADKLEENGNSLCFLQAASE